MKKAVWIVVVLVVLVGGWLLMRDVPAEVENNEGATEETQLPVTEKMPATAQVTITGSNFKYDLAEIRVKRGQTVQLTFKNADGFHDWVVDEFNARTKQIKGPAEETIEFLADKAGTFEYYCSVGQHRQMGMKGNLIVEE